MRATAFFALICLPETFWESHPVVPSPLSCRLHPVCFPRVVLHRREWWRLHGERRPFERGSQLFLEPSCFSSSLSNPPVVLALLLIGLCSEHSTVSEHFPASASAPEVQIFPCHRLIQRRLWFGSCRGYVLNTTLSIELLIGLGCLLLINIPH